MAGIYSGPVIWTLSGDRSACAALEGRSRTCVQWLFETIQHNGARNPFGTRQQIWVWPDGALRAMVMIDRRGQKSAWCELIVIAPAAEQLIVSEAQYREFHGYVPYGGLLVPPYTIYCPEWLAGYLATEGTEIPAGDNTYFMGRYQLSGVNIKWSDPLPELDEDNGYLIPEDIPWNVSPIADASLYSGLARFLVQSIQGACRSLSEIVPIGWSVAPGKLGCSRSPDGVYWVVNIDASGAEAVRLDIPTITNEKAVDSPAMIAEWSRGTVFTDARDRLLAEASALGQAVVTDDVVRLLTAVDMEPVYEDNLSPLVWGWCGRFQKRGEVDEHTSGYRTAICGEFGEMETWRIRSRVCEIDISWENGIPSATLTVGANEDWSTGGTAGDRILIDDGSFICWVMRPQGGAAIRSASGTLAAWYDPDGSKNHVKFSGVGPGGNQTTYLGIGSTNGAYYTACICFNTVLHDGGGKVYTSSSVSANWYFGNGDALQGNRPYYYDEEYVQIYFERQPDAQVEYGQPGAWIIKTWDGCLAASEAEWMTRDLPQTYTVFSWSLSGKSWYKTYSMTTTQHVLLGRCPGTAYAIQSQAVNPWEYNRNNGWNIGPRDQPWVSGSNLYGYEQRSYPLQFANALGAQEYWSEEIPAVHALESIGVVCGERVSLSAEDEIYLASLVVAQTISSPCFDESLGGRASYGGNYKIFGADLLAENATQGPAGVNGTFIGGL